MQVILCMLLQVAKRQRSSKEGVHVAIKSDAIPVHSLLRCAHLRLQHHAALIL